MTFAEIARVSLDHLGWVGNLKGSVCTKLERASALRGEKLGSEKVPGVVVVVVVVVVVLSLFLSSRDALSDERSLLVTIETSSRTTGDSPALRTTVTCDTHFLSSFQVSGEISIRPSHWQSGRVDRRTISSSGTSFNERKVDFKVERVPWATGTIRSTCEGPSEGLDDQGRCNSPRK